ncbi:4'-phosphopantetheinyl transferase family protein [Xylanibacter muris]|uniref:4'-phosphopantetheinyl transferase superfamily protein n=2 Tax=Xylanibacter muris TaxID=2736290 RepID=A0ABX2AK87_9BACT|nr:4'-phosphopantetheinyl transferase superfamily protein [Xylanibacter muris]NPD91608.1 4'-phosphopantetheinyl transferase superfamily protein [Xylanibacter muris]
MIYIDDKFDFDLDVALREISVQRRQSALRFKKAEGRILSVAAYLLLKRSLRDLYGFDCNPDLGYEQNGKPFIVGHPEVCFNISHCRKAAACAVDGCPVGVDVETLRPFREELACHVLSGSEYAAVVGSENPETEFIRLWTMKESFLKLTGEGIRTDLKTLFGNGNGCADEYSETYIVYNKEKITVGRTTRRFSDVMFSTVFFPQYIVTWCSRVR